MTEQISTTSKIYANSLLDIGLSSDVIMDNLTVIKEVSDIPDFKALIINPTIDGNKKAEIIDEIFRDRLDEKQDKIEALNRELLLKNLEASQIAQTTQTVDAIYNRLDTCPVGTTPVYGRTPIFTCNGGCGCGNTFGNTIV